jgi:hypothetical protein
MVDILIWTITAGAVSILEGCLTILDALTSILLTHINKELQRSRQPSRPNAVVASRPQPDRRWN